MNLSKIEPSIVIACAGGFIINPFNADKVMETIGNCVKLKQQG